MHKYSLKSVIEDADRIIVNQNEKVFGNCEL
jgi:hypothetical protein